MLKIGPVYETENCLIKLAVLQFLNIVHFETGLAWGLKKGSVTMGIVREKRALIHEMGKAQITEMIENLSVGDRRQVCTWIRKERIARSRFRRLSETRKLTVTKVL